MTARASTDYFCARHGWVNRWHEHFDMPDDDPLLIWRWEQTFGLPATPANVAKVERDLVRTVRGYL